jgi:hypothetical protein
MPQLAENKQNELILIANFEPSHCARKSARHGGRALQQSAGRPATAGGRVIEGKSRSLTAIRRKRGWVRDDRSRRGVAGG